MKFTSHRGCIALTHLFRGKLCESLSSGPGRFIEARKFIYNTGDLAQSIYFLRSGIVRTSIVSETEDELILQVVKPGEIFGELCFCEDRRQEQAVAMERSEIVEIPFDDLISSLQQNRELMLEFIESVSKHLSDAYDQSFQLAVQGTMKRLVNVLSKLAREFGHSTSKGTEIGHYIKQEELAHMIAARREVTSSLLNRLREMGLIEYSRKGRLIIHTEALEKYPDSE
jgi:CRP/FNR family cyclic AMP-dependent transcriptional regulator